MINKYTLTSGARSYKADRGSDKSTDPYPDPPPSGKPGAGELQSIVTMSKDKDNIPTKYYVKHLDRAKGAIGAYGAPNWCIYERLPQGSNAVCQCYDEAMAQRIIGLLEDSERDAERHGQR
jgi:hypothetical protein